MSIAVPVFTVKIDGKELKTDIANNIQEITVEEEMNLPTRFSIILSSADLESGFEAVNLKTFAPGMAVDIAMGATKAIDLMSGEITTVDVHFGKAPYVEVEGYDKMYRLQFGRKRRSFLKQKDSDIVSTIAGEVGLGKDVEATSTKYPYIYQNNQSNYDFILRRALRIGYEIFYKDKKLVFRKPKEGESPSSDYKFDFNAEGLISFHARLSVINQGSTVDVLSWDSDTQKEVSGTGTSGAEVSKMGGSQAGHDLSKSAITKSDTAVLDDLIIDAADAKTVAEGLFNNTARPFIIGEGEYSGEKQLRIGKTMYIEGLGDKFTGNYYLIATTHLINRHSGYTTKFKVRKTGI